MSTYFVFVLNVRDCLSYDIIFVRDSPDLSPFNPSSNTLVTYCELDPLTYKKTAVKEAVPYPCRLDGISVSSVINRPTTKYETLMWMQNSDCVLECRVKGKDSYGRMLVELIDSEGTSLSEVLLLKFPSMFTKACTL